MAIYSFLVVELDTKFPLVYLVRDYTSLTVATVRSRHYFTFCAYTAALSDLGSSFMSLLRYSADRSRSTHKIVRIMISMLTQLDPS